MNSYIPYGNGNSYDILSIVENEKEIYDKQYNEYIDKKKRFGSFDIDIITDEIQNVLAKTINDVSNKNYSDIFKKDRWEGIGYICMIFAIIGFLINIS